MGIIRKKVTHPTEWCPPVALGIKKNGKIMICVDLKRLENVNVKREKFILRTLKDIFPKLAKGAIFFSLNAESGFWQILLEAHI